MKRSFRFLPLGIIPAALALAMLALGLVHNPQLPALAHRGFQSFLGVVILLIRL